MQESHANAIGSRRDRPNLRLEPGAGEGGHREVAKMGTTS